VTADMAELVTLRERVDGHDARLEALFMLMRETVRAAGIEPDNPAGPEARRQRHLHLVKDGHP
jgi:hypothetical protein